MRADGLEGSGGLSGGAAASSPGLGTIWPGFGCPARPRRRRYSHSEAALHILYGESRMKYTGWCQNDFNVQG
jgi:hypothetical protein